MQHKPTRWFHASWRYALRRHRAEHWRVSGALLQSYDSRAVRAGQRMRRCADTFMAALNLKNGDIKQCPMHCDVMLCPVCLTHRHRTTLDKAYFCLQQSAREGDRIRHIVLTAPRWYGDVRQGAERMAAWFSKLTKRKAWRTKVRAHMAVFECTGGSAERGWHWHIHVLTIGDYWHGQCKVDRMPGGAVADWTDPELNVGALYRTPADPGAGECRCVDHVGDAGRRNAPELRCLMQEWHQVTGGAARIVHISSAGSDHRTADGTLTNMVNEAVKYVVKTVDLDDVALVDFLVGMRSFQRVRWGGEWFGMSPPDANASVARAIVCPYDLWRVSTGSMGCLWARMSACDPLVMESVEQSGWTVLHVSGPLREGQPRPPPFVLLTQERAAAAVLALDETADDQERKTRKHASEHPEQAQAFCPHVPF